MLRDMCSPKEIERRCIECDHPLKKQVNFNRLPECLIIQIGRLDKADIVRFPINQLNSNIMDLRTIKQNQVIFNEEALSPRDQLLLKEIDLQASQKSRYHRLKAVVNHMGEDQNGFFKLYTREKDSWGQIYQHNSLKIEEEHLHSSDVSFLIYEATFD